MLGQLQYSQEQKDKMHALWAQDKAVTASVFAQKLKNDESIIVSPSTAGRYVRAYREGLKDLSRDVNRKRGRGRPLGAKNKRKPALTQTKPALIVPKTGFDDAVRIVLEHMRGLRINRLTIDREGNVSVEKVDVFKM